MSAWAVICSPRPLSEIAPPEPVLHRRPEARKEVPVVTRLACIIHGPEWAATFSCERRYQTRPLTITSAKMMSPSLRRHQRRSRVDCRVAVHNGETSFEETLTYTHGRDLLSGHVRRAFDTEQRALVTDLPVLESRLGQVRAPTWIVTGSAGRVVPAGPPPPLAAHNPAAPPAGLHPGR